MDRGGRAFRSLAVHVATVCLTLLLCTNAMPQRDCFTGPPEFCKRPLLEDPTCRGINTSSVDGWKRMDCDYAVYNIKAKKRKTDKWLVVHAGGCDTYTEGLGDFFSSHLQLNQFGLRPCGGFVNSECGAAHDYDICVALHASWFFPAIKETTPASRPYGLGFNPPALVDIYHKPGTTMLFLHEYGDTNASYPWFAADGCLNGNADKPFPVCMGAIDSNYRSKFGAIKKTLEGKMSRSKWFPCGLEVIDATPYAQDAEASTPCTGILREYHDPALVGGDVNGTAPNWAWEMPPLLTNALRLAGQVEPEGAFIKAFSKAINIALCKTWKGGKQVTCKDGDMN